MSKSGQEVYEYEHLTPRPLHKWRGAPRVYIGVADSREMVNL